MVYSTTSDHRQQREYELGPEPNAIAECLTSGWWERSDAAPNKDERDSNRSREKVIVTLQNTGGTTAKGHFIL